MCDDEFLGEQKRIYNAYTPVWFRNYFGVITDVRYAVKLQIEGVYYVAYQLENDDRILTAIKDVVSIGTLIYPVKKGQIMSTYIDDYHIGKNSNAVGRWLTDITGTKIPMISAKIVDCVAVYQVRYHWEKEIAEDYRRAGSMNITCGADELKIRMKNENELENKIEIKKKEEKE